MTAGVEEVLDDLRVMATGLSRTLEQLAEADHRVGSSVEAAQRGGFGAAVARLRAAQEGIRQVRVILSQASATVSEAGQPIAAAPKEASATEIIGLLSPVTGRVDSIRNDVATARSKLPDLISLVAAAADQNPAIGILGNVGQQYLGILLDRAGMAKQHLDSALGDARRTQSGE
jgi:hypothetical protein